MVDHTYNRDEPFLPDDLARLENQPARSAVPEQLGIFRPIDGMIFDGDARDPAIGVRRLETDASIAAWTINASDAFRWGLPVRSTMRTSHDAVLSALRERGQSSQHERSTLLDGRHHPWNALLYHPRRVTATRRPPLYAKNGRRVTPTAPDAIIFGSDDRVLFYPTGYPWQCIGKVEVWADGNYSAGTGSLVGRSLVLTAGHAVPWSAQNWTCKFTPAYYNGSSTVGPSFYSWVDSAEGYDNGASAWDMALLKLYQPLGDWLGYFGVRTYNTDWDDKPCWEDVGYPDMLDSERPAYMIGIEINDADDDGDATELDSDNQDNSKGNSGGPLFSFWPNGPYVVGVVSANSHTDYGIADDYYVINASGKAMVDLVGLGRLKESIDDGIHIINPPNLNLVGL